MHIDTFKEHFKAGRTHEIYKIQFYQMVMILREGSKKP